MKHLKKMMALVIAMVMVLGMSTMAFAHTTESTVEGAKFTYEGTDKTTDGDIKLKNATKDTTYTLYKIFDATYSGTNVSYTIKTGDLKTELSKDEWKDYFTIGATADGAGNFSVTRTGTTSEGTFAPTKSDADLITKLKTLNTSLFTTIGAIKSNVNGEIEWEMLPYGYFMISPDQPTEGTPVVTIDSNVPTVEIIDKNQTNSFEKDIVTVVNEEEKLVKANEATLKEDVDFRITVQATNYVETDKIFKYVISDTLDNGMTYKALPPTLKVGGTAVTEGVTYKYYDKAGTEVTDISGENLAKVQKFEATINWTNDGTKAGTHRFASNAEITVDYKAYLDPAKADDLTIGGGTDANTNTAQVKYFKGPEDDTPDETTPSGNLGEKKTDTYTTELTILKVDGNDKALQGAEFTLTGPTGSVVITTQDEFTADTTADAKYWKLKDGTYTTDDPTTEGMDRTKYDSTETKYKKTTTTTVTGAGQTQTDIKASVGADGKVNFKGLGAGSYKLVESVVPAGYNKIDDITFDITFDPQYQKDSDNNITGYNGKFEVSNVAPTTMNITVESDSTLYTKIVNQKGTELPSTGGIGTTIFYIIGAILVIGAAVVLVARRKMSNSERD